jgi:hypothetical protein
MATQPADRVTPEMRANQARVAAILRRQAGELEARGQEKAADHAKVRAAIEKIEGIWQRTARV